MELTHILRFAGPEPDLSHALTQLGQADDPHSIHRAVLTRAGLDTPDATSSYGHQYTFWQPTVTHGLWHHILPPVTGTQRILRYGSPVPTAGALARLAAEFPTLTLDLVWDASVHNLGGYAHAEHGQLTHLDEGTGSLSRMWLTWELAAEEATNEALRIVGPGHDTEPLTLAYRLLTSPVTLPPGGSVPGARCERMPAHIWMTHWSALPDWVTRAQDEHGVRYHDRVAVAVALDADVTVSSIFTPTRGIALPVVDRIHVHTSSATSADALLAGTAARGMGAHTVVCEPLPVGGCTLHASFGHRQPPVTGPILLPG